MVGYMDEVCGNITAQLRDKGMYDNTLIVQSSDNGGPIYAGGDMTINGAAGGGANNFPLRGGVSIFPPLNYHSGHHLNNTH